jgi:predicted peptidase
MMELLLATATIALAAQLVAPWVLGWWRYPRPGELGTFETKSGPILIYLPADYDKQAVRWPLIVFLHGAGERGTDINLVKQVGLPLLLDEGLSCPCLVAAPQCDLGASWQTELVMRAVDCVASSFRVDPARIYLTGYSMGGFGTWQVAADVPDRFAAIVPLSGGGEPSRADSLRKTPAWAFHGRMDQVVPIAASQRMVESVQAAGGEARLCIMDGKGHDICREVYGRADLFEWLLTK